MTKVRFVTLGNISIDDLVFADGTTMWCVPGGNSVYSGLGMAVWGERPLVVAPVGPEYPIADLGDRIDISGCRRLERTLRDWGLYEEDGTRHFIFRSNTRNWLDFSPTPDDLGTSGYVNAHLAPLPWALHIALAGRLRAQGAALISCDPDDRYLADISTPDRRTLIGMVDMFLPSRQDAEAMFPGLSPVDALKALRDLAPDTGLIAIKRGKDGAIAHARGAADYISVPSAAEEVVDQTGAGDAFCGGATVGYAAARDPLEALLKGIVSSSFAVAALGPAGLVAADRGVAEARLGKLRGRVEVHPL
jgi:sugar/nucleoside kinase (ribokinase family)